MNQSSIYPGFHMEQIPSLGADPAATATLGYPHHQGWPGKLDQAATMHSMMSFCRVDFPPFKMQTSLPNQMYGHPSYEGSAYLLLLSFQTLIVYNRLSFFKFFQKYIFIVSRRSLCNFTFFEFFR